MASHLSARDGAALSEEAARVTIESPFSEDAETQLLLQVARLWLEAAHHARIRNLADLALDWERVWSVAGRHKMLPLLAMHLRAYAALLPPHFRHHVSVYSLENARRMLRAVSELSEILTRLDEQGVGAVPYKGPVLGAQLYGSAALRQAGDLDILVRRTDVMRARALLLSMGYYPRHTLGAGGEPFMLRSRYSETLDHPTAATVELHWAFTNRDIALPLFFDDLRPNLVPVRIGGATFQGFGREDLLLVLAVHGSKHRWDRLEWLCGLAEAVRSSPPGDVDWHALVERAGALGARRMLLLGLLLAHELLDAPVPPHVLAQARADTAVVRLAAQVPDFLVQEPGDAEGDSLATDLFRYQLRERLRDRARFIAYRVTTPSQPERWTTWQIGGYILPTHAFVRPWRLLGRGISIARARLASSR